MQKTFQAGLNLGHMSILDLSVAQEALEAAQDMGCALLVVNPDGTCTAEAIETGTVPLERLREAVDGYIEPVYLQKPCPSYRGPYLAYANDNGLGVMPYNHLAQQLFGVELCGPLAIEVGFSVNKDGKTVRTPIQKNAAGRA